TGMTHTRNNPQTLPAPAIRSIHRCSGFANTNTDHIKSPTVPSLAGTQVLLNTPPYTSTNLPGRALITPLVSRSSIPASVISTEPNLRSFLNSSWSCGDNPPRLWNLSCGRDAIQIIPFGSATTVSARFEASILSNPLRSTLTHATPRTCPSTRIGAAI